VKSAHVWIDRHGRAEESYRFDVVGVLMDGERVLVKHVEDAFRV
jgi:Holliday junction resolvase-like predicted endonuclease